ncbi:putative toxin-antitoxin system toxin component, PIN family [Terriglobus sp. TAA 43]|uniref:putative toxin-antitoxin system toxin component, PIN family n=1 Tax=Terriglobus sp. TAA 43 TaxID=278961 RepID=UPI0006482965|nr:putative toxin-antitoxin system toxin component, PIN family [Terriglobus sp. TAA 43]
MRLAVFDTNVIISAGIKPGGAPAHLIMDWAFEGQVQAVTSPAIVKEYRQVARRAKFARYGFPPLWLEFLIEESLQLADATENWPTSLPDLADLPFLALAHISGAWLITGNVRHFPERGRQGVNVLTPTEYLNHLRPR